MISEVETTKRRLGTNAAIMKLKILSNHVNLATPLPFFSDLTSAHTEYDNLEYENFKLYF